MTQFQTPVAPVVQPADTTTQSLVVELGDEELRQVAGALALPGDGPKGGW